MDILYRIINFWAERSLTLKSDRRPFSAKSRTYIKKLQSQKHICKKKQTNPLFEDETRYKITLKRRDF